jgi:hypothetical protein
MVAALTVKSLLYASSLFLSFSGASATWDVTSKNNVVVYYVGKTPQVRHVVLPAYTELGPRTKSTTGLDVLCGPQY